MNLQNRHFLSIKEVSNLIGISVSTINRGVEKGTFPPKHKLPAMAIEWIKNNDIRIETTGRKAWRTVGPGLLTRLYWQNKWKDIT